MPNLAELPSDLFSCLCAFSVPKELPMEKESPLPVAGSHSFQQPCPGSPYPSPEQGKLIWKIWERMIIRGLRKKYVL